MLPRGNNHGCQIRKQNLLIAFFMEKFPNKTLTNIIFHLAQYRILGNFRIAKFLQILRKYRHAIPFILHTWIIREIIFLQKLSDAKISWYTVFCSHIIICYKSRFYTMGPTVYRFILAVKYFRELRISLLCHKN